MTMSKQFKVTISIILSMLIMIVEVFLIMAGRELYVSEQLSKNGKQDFIFNSIYYLVGSTILIFVISKLILQNENQALRTKVYLGLFILNALIFAFLIYGLI
ncbi:MAG: hypothetical protein A3F72_07935 [Bacteroidetes bacterium RIFCSPLOWO2_12_FULL_35_15]|nr:MAG: hypothetical protein A3F72_07935 [Bacteroidetes bacterium RIFCSPLOWO2_12_FULL_35_15]